MNSAATNEYGERELSGRGGNCLLWLCGWYFLFLTIYFVWRLSYANSADGISHSHWSQPRTEKKSQQWTPEHVDLTATLWHKYLLWFCDWQIHVWQVYASGWLTSVPNKKIPHLFQYKTFDSKIFTWSGNLRFSNHIVTSYPFCLQYSIDLDLADDVRPTRWTWASGTDPLLGLARVCCYPGRNTQYYVYSDRYWNIELSKVCTFYNYHCYCFVFVFAFVLSSENIQRLDGWSFSTALELKCRL